MTIATQWVTAEAFSTWPDEPGTRSELVRGEVVSMPMPGGEHGAVAAEITRILANHVKPRRLGRVFTEVGFVIATDPDTVRGPDVAFMSQTRWARVRDSKRFLRSAPELVVEVASPGDRPGEIADKIAEWLAFGVDTVWKVDPRSRSVAVHRAGVPAVTLGEAETLDAGDVLRGFACRVGEFFE